MFWVAQINGAAIMDIISQTTILILYCPTWRIECQYFKPRKASLQQQSLLIITVLSHMRTCRNQQIQKSTNEEENVETTVAFEH
jgi:hypothetical protein